MFKTSVRVFFGIGSGDGRVMKIMGKNFTVEEARRVVWMAKDCYFK